MWSVLEDIITTESASDRVVTARGLLTQIDKHFLRFLISLKDILQMCKSVSDFLQSPSNSLSDAIGLIESFRDFLIAERCEEKCKIYWEEADEMAEKFSIPDRKLVRTRHLPARLSDSHVLDTQVGRKKSAG